MNTTTLCHDLTETELQMGGHPLYALATKAGYSSLKTALNANNWWSETVSAVAEILTKEGELQTEDWSLSATPGQIENLENLKKSLDETHKANRQYWKKRNPY